MKIGKVSQTVMKRSVLNLIKYRGVNSYQAPSMEEPCAKTRITAGDLVISTMASAYGDQKDLGIYPITRVVTDLLCRNARPTGVQVIIQLPEHAYESRLKSMVQSMEEHCTKIEVPLLNVQVSTTSTISTSHVTVTGLGLVHEEGLGSIQGGEAGMDIIMVGEVGLEGSLRLLSEKRSELEERFAPGFLRVLENRNGEMKRCVEATAYLAGLEEKIIHQIPDSGVLGALWELGEASGVGMEVELKALPIAQEVIEVCEYMKVNPYRLGSSGAVLVLTKSSSTVIRAMEEAGYKASVIGKTTGEQAKILCNGDDVRHLERPTPNELYKVLEKRQEEC